MKQKVLLVGMYDTSTVSLAPQILRAYAEQYPEIKEGFEISIIEFSIFNDSVEDVAEAINKRTPDIVGFSVYIWNIQEILEVVRRVSARIILGGPQVTGIEKELLKDNPDLDFILTGEGEAGFKQLLEFFLGKRAIGSVQGVTTRELQNERGPSTDLATVPSVYERIFKENPDISWISLETSRGCPMGCGFCTWSSDKKMRYYGIDRVKKDLDVILSQPKVKSIYLCDSSLLLNKPRAKEILNYIIDAKADVSIRYEFSVEQLDEEICDLLACLPRHEFNFGIQSINQKALKDMGRVFRKEVFERHYQMVTEKFRNANNITVDLIYGLPGDNIDGYKQSLDYALSLPEVRRVLTNPLIVLPGSAFFRDREKYKIVLRDQRSYMVKSNYTFSEHEMDLARKYSFYVAVIYFNYQLRDSIKLLARHNKMSVIDTIISFMDNLPLPIVNDGSYPDMVPSVKRGFDQRNTAFVRVIESYDEIIKDFKLFSSHRFDGVLEGYENGFSEHYYKLKRMLLG